MRKFIVTLCLTIAVLLGSEVRGSDLPPCRGYYYHNCFGTQTHTNGDKYVGEFRDGKKHGQGTYTAGPSSKFAGDKYVGEFRNDVRNGQGTYTKADGRVFEGIFENDQFKYAQKVTPTVTARISPLDDMAGPRKGGAVRKNTLRLPVCEGSPTSNPDRLKYWLDCEGEFIPLGSSGVYQYTKSGLSTHPIRYPAHKHERDKALQNDKMFFASLRRSPNPSKDFAEKENERLRQEIARLKKQKQSQPKQVAERTKPKPDLALAKRTQEALQVLEIYSGKIDGIIGVKTRVAIRGWQTRNGYPATGVIDQTQIAKLEESAIRYLKEKKSKPKQVAKKPPPKKSPQPKVGSTGSGFFVSKLGHIITNEHVVRQCGSVTVGDNANKQVKASVLETDKRNDLALLRISSTQMASAETKSLISKLNVQKLGLKLVPLASGGLVRSEDVELGEDVLVAGYPYGELYSNTIKVTGGMVSAVKGMGDDSAQFQMDAAVQPGNSGGPIYDKNGNIVGVVVAQLNKLKVAKAIGSLPENVNFGIKASTVRQFLTSAGLPTKWSNRTTLKQKTELAQIAKNQTVMVVCNP